MAARFCLFSGSSRSVLQVRGPESGGACCDESLPEQHHLNFNEMRGRMCCGGTLPGNGARGPGSGSPVWESNQSQRQGGLRVGPTWHSVPRAPQRDRRLGSIGSCGPSRAGQGRAGIPPALQRHGKPCAHAQTRPSEPGGPKDRGARKAARIEGVTPSQSN